MASRIPSLINGSTAVPSRATAGKKMQVQGDAVTISSKAKNVTIYLIREPRSETSGVSAAIATTKS